MEVLDSVNKDQVRMTVGTPICQERWKRVQTTGHARVLSADSKTDNLDWYVTPERMVVMYLLKV